MPNLLFEIGVEELPAGYIRPAFEQMQSLLGDRLRSARLGFDSIYATGAPRHLVVFAEGVDDGQESVENDVLGPSCKVAFGPDNRPTNAGIGFAKSQGVAAGELKVKETKKGSYCYVVKRDDGKRTIELLPEMLGALIRALDFPKRMIWKARDVSFARPIRSLTALFGAEVVEIELNGIRSGRTVTGNPYITDADVYGIGRRMDLERADLAVYRQRLLDAKVIVDIDERGDVLKKGLSDIMSRHDASFDDKALIDELTNLVEFPTAIECGFDETFLDIPDQVIISAMKGHQRYCPVIDRNGTLLPRFVSVLNMDVDRAEKARDGNERVLRARLADARFFLTEDKKTPLCDRVAALRDMMFHGKLGSYLDRTNRIVNLSAYIASVMGCHDELIDEVKRAAYLCKADLVTAMVGEFPDLQGVMGREYAVASGESGAVASAIEEHYLPRFANDRLPDTAAGTIVSLADKFDMVSGCFLIGLIPTGSQDPFALRRSVQGIIRIVEQNGIRFSIRDIVLHSLTLFPEQKREGKAAAERNTALAKQKTSRPKPALTHDELKDRAVARVMDFFKDRLIQVFNDRGYRYDVINAAIVAGFDDIAGLAKRLQAVSEIAATEFWIELVTVVERTFNISRKQEFDVDVKEELLVEPEEKALWAAYAENRDKINSLIDAEDFASASSVYNDAFTEPVHTFFEKVFVNVEDETIRNNRLMMLKNINELYSLGIADLSRIVVDRG